MKTTNDQKNGKGKRRGCLGCLGRGAIIVAGIVALLLVTGAIYQAAASASDLKKYPPPGQLYEVDGYRMHLYCTGEGSPTVILEAGAGSPGLIWSLVQDEIARSNRVCSYDRLGFGWSDTAPGPRTPSQIADDLHALLEIAGVPGPYIMVGHSAGGVYVRAYASQYPSEVAGMVLVDASHEGQDAAYPPEYQKLDNVQDYMMVFCRLTSPFGGMRLSRMFDVFTAGADLDPEIEAAIHSTLYQTAYCRSSVNEIEALAVSSQPDIPGSLGDLPLIVLTADTSAEEMVAQVPAYLRSVVGPEVFRKVYEVNRDLQQSLVGLSTRGRQVMVPNTGHMIQLEQPGVVIDAIREILDQVRGD